jgi:hypothetical protein
MDHKESLRCEGQELFYFSKDKGTSVVLNERKTHNLEVFKLHDLLGYLIIEFD